MKNKNIIELHNVSKEYIMGKIVVKAIHNLSLKIKKGDFIAFMGPSGSGKSTCMNLVGALDIPTRGHILLEGHDIAQLSESKLAQIRGKKIGFVFQQFNLIPTLTALENVSLPMIFQETTREERKERATSLLKMVGLGERMNHKPSEMSGGEQQRVAIARALVNDPDVLLADEPTGNLDTKTGETVMDFLEKLNKKEKKTIIMVTHDPNIAKKAHKIYYLKDGQFVKKL